MRNVFVGLAAVLALGTACSEPPKVARMDVLVEGLAHLHTWDKHMQGKGQYSYDSIMGWGPEILPVLVAHLTNETPTAIRDEMSNRNPKISDAVFFMLLELTKTKWQDFSKEGVFVSTVLENPIFCLKWDRQTKFRVQKKFHDLIEILEQK
jgi:hypothetical protein